MKFSQMLCMKIIIPLIALFFFSCSDDVRYLGSNQGVHYHSPRFLNNPDHIIFVKDSSRYDSYIDDHVGFEFDSTTWAKTELLFYSLSEDSILGSILIDSGDCKNGRSRAFDIISFSDSLLLYKSQYDPDTWAVLDIQNFTVLQKDIAVENWTDTWVVTPYVINLTESDTLQYFIDDSLYALDLVSGNYKTVSIPSGEIRIPHLLAKNGTAGTANYIIDRANGFLYRYDSGSSSFIELKGNWEHSIGNLESYGFKGGQVFSDSLLCIELSGTSPGYSYATFSIENDSIIAVEKTSVPLSKENGGYWWTASFASDRKSCLVRHYRKETGTVIALLDLEAGTEKILFESVIEPLD